MCWESVKRFNRNIGLNKLLPRALSYQKGILSEYKATVLFQAIIWGCAVLFACELKASRRVSAHMTTFRQHEIIIFQVKEEEIGWKHMGRHWILYPFFFPLVVSFHRLGENSQWQLYEPKLPLIQPHKRHVTKKKQRRKSNEKETEEKRKGGNMLTACYH